MRWIIVIHAHLVGLTGHGVALVLEDPAGDIVGIEAKAPTAISQKDMKRFKDPSERRDADASGGDDSVPFGNKTYAVPIEALWEW